MKQGEQLRTIEKTKMNQTSSRSHTIFIIKFTQKKKNLLKSSGIVSKICLVDLAGY
jgi:hypothetical protein